MKRKTSRKKFNKKVKEVGVLIRKMAVVQGLRIKDMVYKPIEIFVGYFHYYGITDNSKMLANFVYCVKKSACSDG